MKKRYYYKVSSNNASTTIVSGVFGNYEHCLNAAKDCAKENHEQGVCSETNVFIYDAQDDYYPLFNGTIRGYDLRVFDNDI